MKKIFVYLILFFCTPAFSETLDLRLDVSFITGSASLTENGRKIIFDFVRRTKYYPSAKFLISGHTDSMGNDSVNLELSQGRANTVRSFFIKNGISGSKIKTEGLGEKQPIADNSTKIGRKKNRRVVVSLSGIKSQKLKTVEDSFVSISGVEKVKSKKQLSKKIIVKSKPLPNKIEVKPLPETSLVKVAAKPNVERVKLLDRYRLGLGVNHNVLKASDVANTGTDKKAEWVSKNNYNIEGAYQFNIKSNFWLGLQVAYHLQDYEVEADSNFVWDEKDPNLLRVAMIIDYEPSKKWSLGFDVNYNEEAFIYVVPPSVTLRKDAMLGVSVRGAYKWFDSGTFSSRLNLKLSFPIIGFDTLLEPTGKLGYTVGLDGSVKNLFKNHEVNLRLYYGLRDFDHNENTQEEKIVGINFNIRNNLWF